MPDSVSSYRVLVQVPRPKATLCLKYLLDLGIDQLALTVQKTPLFQLFYKLRTEHL